MISDSVIHFQQWLTHGETYEKAFTNGIEVLESLVRAYEASAEPLPEPKTIGAVV